MANVTYYKAPKKTVIEMMTKWTLTGGPGGRGPSPSEGTNSLLPNGLDKGVYARLLPVFLPDLYLIVASKQSILAKRMAARSQGLFMDLAASSSSLALGVKALHPELDISGTLPPSLTLVFPPSFPILSTELSFLLN